MEMDNEEEDNEEEEEEEEKEEEFKLGGEEENEPENEEEEIKEMKEEAVKEMVEGGIGDGEGGDRKRGGEWQLPCYYKFLREVMTYAMRRSNPEGHTFSEMEILWLQPCDIDHWMCLKVYGKDNLSPEDNPTYG
eukprot:6563785-Ditylum_brightwellii.AAC.1